MVLFGFQGGTGFSSPFQRLFAAVNKACGLADQVYCLVELISYKK